VILPSVKQHIELEYREVRPDIKKVEILPPPDFQVKSLGFYLKTLSYDS
jgi:hypothetical protein